MAAPETLTLAQLEAHDPHGGRGSREKRYRCPFDACQGHKNRDLSLDPKTGLFDCFACGAAGKLLDFREPRKPWTRNDRGARLRRAQERIGAAAGFVAVELEEKTSARPEPKPETGGYDLIAETSQARPIDGTPAAEYLQSRGIPADVAHACGVRYAPALGHTVWVIGKDGQRRTMPGAPAVLFPMRGPGGDVVGIQGRVPGPGAFWKDGPNKRTFKANPDATAGAFGAPREAPTLRVLAIVEAPIDALTLHLCGLPSVATVGTNCPEWLTEKLTQGPPRVVFLAHDADSAGEKAAEKLRPELRASGARPVRLRPPTGTKDWNEALQRFGHAALSEALAQTVAPYLTPPPSEEPAPYADPAEGFEIQIPPQLREDALESASSPSEASEHTQRALDALTGHSQPYRPSRFHWPGVGSAEYQDLARAEGEKAQWEACAAAGFRESYALHQLLGRWEAGHNAPHDRATILEKVQLIEEEAIAANPQRRL